MLAREPHLWRTACKRCVCVCVCVCVMHGRHLHTCSADCGGIAVQMCTGEAGERCLFVDHTYIIMVRIIMVF